MSTLCFGIITFDRTLAKKVKHILSCIKSFSLKKEIWGSWFPICIYLECAQLLYQIGHSWSFHILARNETHDIQKSAHTHFIFELMYLLHSLDNFLSFFFCYKCCCCTLTHNKNSRCHCNSKQKQKAKTDNHKTKFLCCHSVFQFYISL